MFLSAHEIASNREQAISNLLELSQACIQAGQRLADLLSDASREAIQNGTQQLAQLGQAPLEPIAPFQATAWQENNARAGRLLESTLEIFGDAQKAMIRSAEAQVRVFDQIVIATINRTAKTSPWEAEVALKAMKTSLETAEQTLHDMSEAAIETVELAGNEIHQVTTTLADTAPATRRRASRKAAG